MSVLRGIMEIKHPATKLLLSIDKDLQDEAEYQSSELIKKEKFHALMIKGKELKIIYSLNPY